MSQQQWRLVDEKPLGRSFQLLFNHADDFASWIKKIKLVSLVITGGCQDFSQV